MTAADIARRLRWGKTGRFDDLEIPARRLALASTTAQLIHMAERGLLESEKSPQLIRYRKAA